MEIDTWVAGEGKNGMRRDWLVTDFNTGEILARATRLVRSTHMYSSNYAQRMFSWVIDAGRSLPHEYMQSSATMDWDRGDSRVRGRIQSELEVEFSRS